MCYLEKGDVVHFKSDPFYPLVPYTKQELSQMRDRGVMVWKLVKKQLNIGKDTKYKEFVVEKKNKRKVSFFDMHKEYVSDELLKGYNIREVYKLLTKNTGQEFSYEALAKYIQREKLSLREQKKLIGFPPDV